MQVTTSKDAGSAAANCSAHHLGAARRHALGQDAAAAAHVHHALAGEGGAIVDIVQPQGIDVVQRFVLAVGIPPAVGGLIEFGDFLGIHVDLGVAKRCMLPLTLWDRVGVRAC
jgi:hypothetical protein